MPTREAYCTRAFLCMAQAFICGLKSGPAPLNPNALDTLTGEAIGGGVGALGTGGASATSSSSGTPQGTVQWPLQDTAALLVPPPAPAYTTIQHPLALAYAPSCRGHRPPAAGAAGASSSASLARDPGARAAYLYAAGGRSSHGRVLRSHLVQQRGGGCRGCAAPRPSDRRLHSIPRCRRVPAASGGEEAPAPERAQTVSVGLGRGTR
jgi:hypothetical protein